MGLKRGRSHGSVMRAFLTVWSGLALAAVATASASASRGSGSDGRTLGVMVPAHRGDLAKAMSSLERWPSDECSDITKKNVDLVLYYAEGETDTDAAKAVTAIAATAGRCFANTRIVYANLREEDDFYPKGPSVQFYKMFLDEDVRDQLAVYDALAIIEWDVLVASDRSFAELYHASFDTTEDFWVKGSNLEGTSFHHDATSTDMWHMLGHINGNAIYNNNDPAFVEYVDYTLSRWEYKYAYDVALWATISDFPYSWPLWQRYSSKFVTTNLISNVGFEHVDTESVSTAVAAETLFIHGSSIDAGSVTSARATTASARLPVEDDVLLCEDQCGAPSSSLPAGTSTVCDETCVLDGRFNGHLCGAGDSSRFGAMCRLCYTDVLEARRAESHLSGGRHVIMCDTKRPPQAEDCSDKCALKKDTVCDESCGSGDYGDYNCNWREHGTKCRFCFDDNEAALVADMVAKRHGGRVIMCDTHEPPVTVVLEVPEEPIPATTSRRLRSVNSDEYYEDERSNRQLGQKWQSDRNWQAVEEWGENSKAYRHGKKKSKKGGKGKNGGKGKKSNKDKKCSDDCEYTSHDGTRGRVCDNSCRDGHPYGTKGCGAKVGQHGDHCRVCYNDESKAIKHDSPENRAIMCDTLQPLDAERRLLISMTQDAPANARQLQKWKENQKWKTVEEWTEKSAKGKKSDRRRKNKKGKNGKSGKGKKGASESSKCDDDCEYTSRDGTKGRVCDSSCSGSSAYGKNGCNAKDGRYGKNCRVCYNDEAKAAKNDDPTHRSIMCDSLQPLDAERRLLTSLTQDAPNAARQLQKWKENRKWNDVEKWTAETVKKSSGGKGDKRDNHRRNGKKGKKGRGGSRCQDGCEHTSRDGTQGRVCDSSCSDGDPFGTHGCDAKGGQYGENCRVCYNDEAKAMDCDTPTDRAIMCDSLMPLDAERRILSELAPSHRRLSAVRPIPAEADANEDIDVEGEDDFETFIANSASIDFNKELTRGDLCAFIAGDEDQIEQTDVTVQSILEFLPGMRIAIAAESDDLAAYKSTVGTYPGVTVSYTPSVRTSALFADEICGSGAKLIYYVQPGSILSRTFSSKDTHSPKGDLLVVYSDARASPIESEMAHQTTAVLGFNAPSFTFGTDLFLPVHVNTELRMELVSGLDVEEGDEGVTALAEIEAVENVSVPQLMAALAYSRNTAGVWFLNPQAWVSQHLFKTASIWDVPLVKPRFACSIEHHVREAHGDAQNAAVLTRNLEFFQKGGSCDNGLIAAEPETVPPTGPGFR